MFGDKKSIDKKVIMVDKCVPRKFDIVDNVKIINGEYVVTKKYIPIDYKIIKIPLMVPA